MSLIEKRTKENSLTIFNPLDEIKENRIRNDPTEFLKQVQELADSVIPANSLPKMIPFYDPEYVKRITEIGQLLAREYAEKLTTDSQEKSVPQFIFLDIDGVLVRFPQEDNDLHESDAPYGQFDKNCIRRLLNILDEFRNARLVISSTWRKSQDKMDELETELRSYLEEGFDSYWYRVQGTTHITNSGFRGLEVEMWLRETMRLSGQQVSYVIIDDDSDFYPHQLEQLVQTDPSHGITETAEYRIKQRLKKIVTLR